MVQRRVAVAVGGARIGAVGEQGHHRFGAAMPAVTGRRQQRGHAAVRRVHVDAAGDQLTQQAQVRQHRGQDRHRPAAAAGRGRCGHGGRRRTGPGAGPGAP
ncbi:hypothetical protein G6F57_023380 [Rhizopus arrhizus]|nr:hypothetical protein G6F57_023380 [Rhizopus arrhizus]